MGLGSGIMISQLQIRPPCPELHILWTSINRYLFNSALHRGNNKTPLSLLFDCYPLCGFLVNLQWFIR